MWFLFLEIFKLTLLKALVQASQPPEEHLRSTLHSTRGVIFLGTPHQGSGLAQWAEKLAKSVGVLRQTNAEIIAVLKTESEILARIQRSFHSIIRSRVKGLKPIDITCFYEQLPLPVVGTVSGTTRISVDFLAERVY